MPNTIKQYDDSPSLQVTREARRAGLAEEHEDDDRTGPDRWKRFADVLVYGFDGAVLIVDADEDAVTPGDRADLVAVLARDTDSIHEGHTARIRPAGNGLKVTLPGLEPTGLEIGQQAPAHVLPDALLVTAESKDGARLAGDLRTVREDQVSDGR